jgi:serine beta-lactamase-like protein LACTB, mitochondrial
MRRKGKAKLLILQRMQRTLLHEFPTFVPNSYRMPSLQRLLGLTLAGVCFVFSSLFAQIDLPLDSATRQRLDSVIEAERALQQIVGLAVTVVRDGQISMARGYGYSDWESLRPVDTQTIFRWASMSKSLTSVTAFKLKEQGLINLDSTARHYIPEFNFEGVRVGHLLQNRSGLGHYDEMNKTYPEWGLRLPFYPNRDTLDMFAAVNIFKGAPLQFVPGERNLYSTFGFVVAGLVIDRIGVEHFQKGYPTLVNEYIASPLGMTTLKPELKDPLPQETTGYYLDNESEIQVRKDDDIRWKLAGGGFHSNILDLGRYVSGLMTGKILSPESYAQMWTKQADADYAYGFDVKGEGDLRSVGHSGAQAKTRTVFMIFPAYKIGIGVMCNSEWASPERMAHIIARALGIEVKVENYQPACNEKSKSKNSYLAIVEAGTGTQLIRKAYPSRQFQAEVAVLAKVGYRLQEADSYLDKSNVRRWDGVFRLLGPETQFMAQQSPDSFNVRINRLAKEGFHLIDMETYIANKNRLWAGVFQRNEQPAQFFHDLEETQFQKKFQELSRKGQQLVDIKNYWDGKTRRWAGLFVPGRQSQAFLRNLTEETFWQKDKTLAEQGLKLIDVEVHVQNRQTFWSGVWQQENGNRQLIRDNQSCIFQKRCQGLNEKGLLIVEWERF